MGFSTTLLQEKIVPLVIRADSVAADLGEAPGSGDRGYGWGCLFEPAPMYACKKNI